MFLNDNKKKLKSSALDELLSNLDGLDSEKIGKSKKPMIAEMSVTKVEPKGKLPEQMKAIGHEATDEIEESVFPEEQKEEYEGGISEEEKSMIEELYNRYCR